MATNVGHLEATLGLNTAALTAGLSRAQASMRKAGTAMATAGRRLTTNLSLPLALVGGAAIKLAIDFETSMAKIVGQVGIASKTVRAMGKDVKDLAVRFGRGPKELAEALFFITSAGLRGKDAMDVLTISAKGAMAQFGETKVIADLLTSATNAYGIANLSAAKAGDILAATVREGKRPADEIASSFGFVLPIASELGVTFDEVGGAIAAMSRTGTGASTAVIQLRQILFSILKPSLQAEEAFEKMGTSSARLRGVLAEKGGLVQLLSFLRHETKTNSQAFAHAFPNIRALAGALDIMGKNMQVNLGIFKRIPNSLGDMDRAAQAFSETAGFKLNQALAELKVTAIELGDILLPMFLELVRLVANVVKGFQALSSSNKILTASLGLLFIALGPILIILGKILIAITLLISPVTLVVAGVAVLIAVFALFQHNSDLALFNIRNSFKRLKNDIIDVAQVLLLSFVKAFDKIIDGINLVRIHLNLIPIESTLIKKAGKLVSGLEDMKAEIKDSGIEFISFKDIWIEGVAKMEKAITSLFKAVKRGGIDLEEVDVTTPKGGRKKFGDRKGATIGGGSALRDIIQKITFASAATAKAFAEMEIKIGENLRHWDRWVVELAILQAKAGDNFEFSWKVIKGILQDGFNFSQQIASSLASVFVSIGESIGNSLVGADDAFSTAFERILLIVLNFAKMLGGILIAIGTAIILIPGLQGPAGLFIGAGIGLTALATAGTSSINKKIAGREARAAEASRLQGLATGGFVTEGGVFRLHRDELVHLPTGSAVTPSGSSRAGNGRGGSLTTQIGLRTLIIELDKERKRMGR